MKKRNMIWNIPAILAVLCLAFVFANCGNNTTIRARVYTSGSPLGTGIDIVPFTGNRSVAVNIISDNLLPTGITGTINNGLLNITLKALPDNLLENIAEKMGDGFILNPTIIPTDATIIPADARGAFNAFFVTSGEDRKGFIRRLSFDEDEIEYVLFWFVDRDVTISAPRFEWSLDEISGFTMTPTHNITNAFTLNLRHGWNTVHERISVRSGTNISTLSIGDPAHLRWVLSEW